ncbi:putative isoflavone reductase like protein [Tricladium varicosporioides]|nr:putative isoflavone reductase like protein [Hymenoscyphus varicosporioides]
MAGPMKENLLMFGATGYIGAFIINKIVENKASFGRIAIFTSSGTVESKADDIQNLKNRGVEVIVGDVTKSDEILKAYQGIHTVISAVGRNVIAQQIDWIKLADESPSVKRFLPSEYGTDIEYNETSATEIPHQQKLKVRAALRDTKSLDYTYIVTGPYADASGPAYLGALPLHADTGSYNVKDRSAVLIGDGNGKVSLTTCTDVGRLVVKALLHPKESQKKALRVNSFTTTPASIVAEFERQTGETWSVTYTSLDKLRELEKHAYETKVPIAPVFTLRRIWAEGGTLYEKRDNALIDADDMDTLENAVRDAIAVQLSGKGEERFKGKKFQ